jgi:hypothetical protein
MTTRTCSHPDHIGPRELPLSEFWEKPRSPGGRDPACSACRNREEKLRLLIYRETCLDRYAWLDRHGRRVCACRGCEGTEHLEIDHLSEHSPAQGRNGSALTRWLVNNGLPNGFQVLCRACNRSKHSTGACRRDHGTGRAAVKLPARWEPPAGYLTAGLRSKGKVIVAAWLAAHAADGEARMEVAAFTECAQ